MLSYINVIVNMYMYHTYSNKRSPFLFENKIHNFTLYDH